MALIDDRSVRINNFLVELLLIGEKLTDSLRIVGVVDRHRRSPNGI
ncbi:hypothetical protein [Mycobacterium sp.]